MCPANSSHNFQVIMMLWVHKDVRVQNIFIFFNILENYRLWILLIFETILQREYMICTIPKEFISESIIIPSDFILGIWGVHACELIFKQENHKQM
jgi:hypothetical protein